MKKASKRIALLFILSIIMTFSFLLKTYASNTTINNGELLELSIKQLSVESDSKFNIKVLDDGSFTVDSLYDDKVPKIYEGAKKYGLINSKPIEAEVKFRMAIFNIDTIDNDQKYIIFVEAGASKDCEKWTEWFEASDKNGYKIDFHGGFKFIRYRIRIVSYSDTPPIVKHVGIKLVSISDDDIIKLEQSKPYDGNTIKYGNDKKSLFLNQDMNTNLMSNQFYIFATQEGLVGRQTANGHIIKSTDIYVALPSFRVLNTRDTYTDFTINITYNGTTLYNVPVWDVGPINHHDDYWNSNYYPEGARLRSNFGYEGYGDIPRGYAEAYYAKNYEFHNTWSSSHPGTNNVIQVYQDDNIPGTQESHIKINPTYPNWSNTGAEIDLSDEVWRQLGMTDNNFVTIEINWFAQ